ncbi:hypothetical protein PGTUg99_021446 [Puccinia graminis f. sp. tritici]|uniref:Uncharacterized protein n=1 Tax=Puccinia graminis f. sp. tritici TaxID=56615 RepID=A0A5B0NH73_PUCGR|nr:hypothetical protein PGTUg99_021446 [Puccinia graminis f. sp. tritici]
MGPMETTTQALNLEQTSVQGLKPEGHHTRFESWPMALKIPVGPRPGSYRDYTFVRFSSLGVGAPVQPRNPCPVLSSDQPLAKIQTLDDGLQASNLERMSVQGSKPG